MEPGLRTDEETGIKYAKWVCPGCGRKEEWGVGRDPDWSPPGQETSRDLIE